ncbi:hypothetical protein, partial [Lacticaseibacillus pantheris]|uniref:hypothetical protein n=1 Tax=Lacticaseibacillus pantheris TaxID=171523 RepID=UPI001CDB0A81
FVGTESDLPARWLIECCLVLISHLNDFAFPRTSFRINFPDKWVELVIFHNGNRFAVVGYVDTIDLYLPESFDDDGGPDVVIVVDARTSLVSIPFVNPTALVFGSFGLAHAVNPSNGLSARNVCRCRLVIVSSPLACAD